MRSRDGLTRVREAMRRHGVDALLLSGDGAGAFAGGHRRIGVHTPGAPLPATVVTLDQPPHVVTADPDGATHLPAGNVHALIWNPRTLAERLPEWLGAAASGVVGVDTLSPGGFGLVTGALPHARIVDANRLLAEARLVKQDDERAALARACDVAHEAARAGRGGDRDALQLGLHGHFVAATPRLGATSTRVAVLVDGFAGEARLGTGDPDVLHRAVAELRPGRSVADVATDLPATVEVIGLGRGYEPPVMRGGLGSPAGLTLEAGCVLLVATAHAAVTLEVGAPGSFYSPTPQEVAG